MVLNRISVINLDKKEFYISFIVFFGEWYMFFNRFLNIMIVSSVDNIFIY